MPSSPDRNAIQLIVAAGLASEFILPWLLIGLSDLLLFDVPAWSLWAVLGGPPVATLAAVAAYLGAAGARRRRLEGWSRPRVDASR